MRGKDHALLQAEQTGVDLGFLLEDVQSSPCDPLLRERLDERAHANAFSVSESLKYALREAIEILGNEAARQLDEVASGSKKSIYSGAYKLNSGELSLECLRMVYRLLFIFYIEARPELGYVL
mgnify:CR=1 FL=1